MKGYIERLSNVLYWGLSLIGTASAVFLFLVLFTQGFLAAFFFSLFFFLVFYGLGWAICYVMTGQKRNLFQEVRTLFKTMIAMIVISLAFGYYNTANATCVCRCIDGQNQPICENTIDLRPVCPPKICPLRSPSVKPVSPPSLRPLGTSFCGMKQIFNPHTHRYEWRKVCSH